MHLCTTFILLLILLLMLSLSCILYALLVQWELSYISTRSSICFHSTSTLRYHKEHKDVSYASYLKRYSRSKWLARADFQYHVYKVPIWNGGCRMSTNQSHRSAGSVEEEIRVPHLLDR